MLAHVAVVYETLGKEPDVGSEEDEKVEYVLPVFFEESHLSLPLKTQPAFLWLQLLGFD